METSAQDFAETSSMGFPSPREVLLYSHPLWNRHTAALAAQAEMYARQAEPPPPRRMKMTIDDFNLDFPNLIMTPETAMLLRDELKRVFDPVDDNYIMPDILPPEVNIHIPLINYTSLAYTPYDFADEFFQVYEDLWTKHLQIISQEAQNYHAQHGFYPWEEESAAGLGDASAAPYPTPESEPVAQVEAENAPAALPDLPPDPVADIMYRLFFEDDTWVNELDWEEIKNNLREFKEDLLARAIELICALRGLVHGGAPETSPQDGENAPKAPVLAAPAAEEAVEGEAPDLSMPLDPTEEGYSALVSYYPADAEDSWKLEEGTLAKARVDGALLGMQTAGDAFSGSSTLFQKFLDDVLRQGYPSWETIKEINDAKDDFAHNLLTIDIALQEAIDAFAEGLHTADKLEALGCAPDAAALRAELSSSLFFTLVFSTFGGPVKGNALNALTDLAKGSKALLKEVTATEKTAAAATKEVRAAEKAVAATKEIKATRVETVVKAKSKVWEELQPYKGKFRTNGEKGSKLRYYKWDYTHNDIEVYDGNWNHLGSIDPVTGEPYKPGKPNRKEGF